MQGTKVRVHLRLLGISRLLFAFNRIGKELA